MPYFDSGGVRIHYEDQGEGAPVILVHGFGTDARAHWGDSGLIRFLATRYRVIAPDARGHGRSDKPHSRDLPNLIRVPGEIPSSLVQERKIGQLIVGRTIGSDFRQSRGRRTKKAYAAMRQEVIRPSL